MFWFLREHNLSIIPHNETSAEQDYVDMNSGRLSLAVLVACSHKTFLEAKKAIKARLFGKNNNMPVKNETDMAKC